MLTYTSYLAPFPRYRFRQVQNLYMDTPLAFNPPPLDEDVPLGRSE